MQGKIIYDYMMYISCDLAFKQQIYMGSN